MFKRLVVTVIALCAPLVPASANDFEDLFGKLGGDGVRVCSAVVKSNWRNDLMVPLTWDREACQAWAKSIGAVDYNLGCLRPRDVIYDISPGWNPANNCGWH